MNEKVLVVDDNADYMQLMVRHLNRQGYNAVGRADPVEALALFKEEGDFMVIVTDWVMPEMKGDALIRAAQAFDPKIQAVIITAYAKGMKTPSGMGGWGNFKHLNKPLNKMSDLSAAVKYALDFRAVLYPEG